MARLLVVEDDAQIRDMLEAVLTLDDHEVVMVPDAGAALAALERERPQMVISDLMLPDQDGYELCKQIRAHPLHGQLPFLMLTARADQTDKYRGFKVGADDYLTKPFDALELQLRVRALLRRSHAPASEAPEGSLTVGALRLDPDRYALRVHDREVLLTQNELAVMLYLMSNPGKVVSTETLLTKALDYPPGVGTPDIVHAHVRNLRQKIEENPASPRLLRTVSRLGYTVGDA